MIHLKSENLNFPLSFLLYHHPFLDHVTFMFQTDFNSTEGSTPKLLHNKLGSKKLIKAFSHKIENVVSIIIKEHKVSLKPMLSAARMSHL